MSGSVLHPRSDDAVEHVSPRRHKRMRTSSSDQHDETPHHDNNIYTVAWICALEIEMHAGRAMLDEIHQPLPQPPNDSTEYTLGSIRGHNIVMARLPTDQYTPNDTLVVLTNLKSTFPSIRLGMMVGIGSGVPTNTDVRLGDVVVGTRVMPVDSDNIIRSAYMQTSPSIETAVGVLGTAVSTLREKHEQDPTSLHKILLQRFIDDPAYQRSDLPDTLESPARTHIHQPEPTYNQGNKSSPIRRSIRPSKAPSVHYGAIASVNKPINDCKSRDDLARRLDVICIHMRVPNLMRMLPCIPIRGISNYADSDQDERWQKCAAASAAAFARQLLTMPNVTGDAHNPVRIPDTSGYTLEILRQRRLNLMKTLQFENRESTAVNINNKVHPGTCSWMLEHPDYTTWLDTSNSSEQGRFLWISGRPGSGKSTLMNFLCQNNTYSSNGRIHKRNSSGEHYAVISYFFRAHRRPSLSRSISGMYRSLLLQVLERFNDLQAVADNLGCDPLDYGCPPLNVLKDLFRKAILAYSDRAFTCFIDTVDACDEQEVIDMVRDFEDLVEEASKRRIKLRICFSSRHYPYIKLRQGLQLKLLDQQGHMADLRRYIEENLHVKDPELTQQMLSKAGGAFLWIVLVVNILNQANDQFPFNLKQELSRIPSGLAGLFGSILTRDYHGGNEFLFCLILILSAKRPLRFREFQHATSPGVVVSIDDPNANFDSLEALRMRLSSSFQGLVRIMDDQNHTVQFIHESVQDFLVNENQLQQLYPHLGPDWQAVGHEMVKNRCSTYMQVYNGPARDKLFRSACDSYPFLEYCYDHILFHSNSAANVVDQQKFLNATDNRFRAYKLKKFNMSPNNSSPTKLSLLYILVRDGYADLIRATNIKNNFGTKDGIYHISPFFSAVLSGKKDLIAALLNMPACIDDDGQDVSEDPDLKSVFVDWRQMYTPIAWAAGKGNMRFVKLFLKPGGCLMKVVKPTITKALLAATRNKHFECLDFLERTSKITLSREDWQVTDDPMASPVDASECGSDAAAQTFSTAGANVDGATRSPLQPLVQAEKTVQPLVEAEKTSQPLVEAEKTIQPLVEAAKTGSLETVKLLLSRGDDSCVAAENVKVALIAAVQHSHVAVTKSLLEWQTVKNNMCVVAGMACLIALAIEAGQKDTVQALVDSIRFKIDGIGEGLSLLTEAISIGHEGVVKVLLENGAKMDLRDGGWSMLAKAITLGHGDVVRVLVENGARVDANGLMLAKAINLGHDDVVKALLEKGARVDPIDGGCSMVLTAIALGHESVVKVLLENGIEMDPSDGGYSMLLKATIHGYKGIIKVLLENITKRDPGNGCYSMLLTAITRGHESVTKVLLENGALMDSSDRRRSMLFKAIALGQEGAVRMLLEKGASLTAASENDISPLFLASRQGRHAIARLLLEKGAEVDAVYQRGWTPLAMAAKMGHEKVVRLLLNNGADLDVTYRFGWSPLYEASKYGHMEIVKVLLQRGADINFPDSFGRTPLLIASQEGHSPLVRNLLIKGAATGPVSRDDDAATSISTTCPHEHISNLTFTKEAGIPDIHPSFESPLLAASKNGHDTIAWLLMHHGQRATPKGSRHAPVWPQNTPLFWAILNGHLPVVKLLLDMGACNGLRRNCCWDPIEFAGEREQWGIHSYLVREITARERAAYFNPRMGS